MARFIRNPFDPRRSRIWRDPTTAGADTFKGSGEHSGTAALPRGRQTRFFLVSYRTLRAGSTALEVRKKMLKIRLRRMGARNNPFFRVVVSDSRQVPTASAVEEVGHYDPTKVPAQVTLNSARIEYWVGKGAQMSPTVKRLLHQSHPSQAKKSA
jgi:small subunit ribosomal protein S16